MFQAPWMGSLFSSAWLYYQLDLQLGSSKLLTNIENKFKVIELGGQRPMVLIQGKLTKAVSC